MQAGIHGNRLRTRALHLRAASRLALWGPANGEESRRLLL